MSDLKEVSIYTDGACSGNPGPGGWCAILLYKKHEKKICGNDKEATNNRMELKAALEGLGMLKERCRVKLYSDSSYLVNAFNLGWLDGWVKNGWRKQDKAPVKNADLWSRLYEYSKKHIVTWIKVKGHSDNELNNRCDKEAVEQIKLLKEGKDAPV